MEYQCKRYDYANMICELMEMKDCNNDADNKEECNAVISYLNTI